jgi:hypothetical protein
LFVTGNGYGALEFSKQLRVGTAPTREECVQMVTDAEPDANGVSYPRNGNTDCYAEFNMTAIDSTLQTDWQTCLIAKGSVVDAYDYCRNQIDEAANKYLTGAGCEVGCISTDAMDAIWTSAPGHEQVSTPSLNMFDQSSVVDMHYVGCFNDEKCGKLAQIVGQLFFLFKNAVGVCSVRE